MFFVTRPRLNTPSLYWSRSVPASHCIRRCAESSLETFIETVAMALGVGFCCIKMSKEESVIVGPFDL